MNYIIASSWHFTLFQNNHYQLRKNPEERSSHVGENISINVHQQKVVQFVVFDTHYMLQNLYFISLLNGYQIIVRRTG